MNKIATKRLVIGYNHHFGRNREGTLEHLLECGPIYGFEVDEIPAADIDNVDVSSTKIRKAISKGDVETASSFLGHNYFLSGVVVKGDGRGKQIGYPTANIYIENEMKLIPADGVYAVNAIVGDRSYQGMMNIGTTPTIEESNVPRGQKIEVNIFDFNLDIYEEVIRVEMVARLRDEVKFDSVDSLATQLTKDKDKALTFLSP